MRLTFFIMLLILSRTLYGQQLIFDNNAVDTIIIKGTAGAYQFDKKGTTLGQRDEFIIIFDKASNKYFGTHKRTRLRGTFRPPSHKEIEKRVGKVKQVNRNLIDSLLKSLTDTSRIATFDILGLDSQSFRNETSRRDILRIAKFYEEDWQFKPSYSDKDRNKLLFKGCQQIDTFNSFLTQIKCHNIGYPYVTDYWDEINIYFSASNERYNFQGKYPNKLKLPWYYFRSNESTLPLTSIYNLYINKWLVQILPKGFCRRNTIEERTLIDEYIKWYLLRREILNEYDVR